MNVFDFAMEMEMDGKAHYEKLASEATTTEFKNLFTILAESEQSHYDALQNMKNGVDAVKVDSKVLENAKHIFDKLLTVKEDRDAPPDGYLQVIRAEEASIRLYEEAAEKENNETAKNLLLSLAGEEKEHLSIVKYIYDFVEAPRTFLAWGEFSNLKGL